jgi:dipeptidyl aminopeptidase/acylaminoacyl peptidase
MVRFIVATTVALALVACGKDKKKTPPRPTSPPTAAPRAAPNPAQQPVAIAVSKFAVFVALADGRVEKRPLGKDASKSLAASREKSAPTTQNSARPKASSDAFKVAARGSDSRASQSTAAPDSGASREALTKPSGVLTNGKGIRAMAAASGGSLLAVTHEFARSREVWLYDQATLTISRRLGTETDGSHRLLLSADGSRLVAQGRNVTIWDTGSGEKLQELSVHKPQDVRMSADGSVLAIQQRGEESFERPMKGGGHEWVMPSPSIVVMQADGKRLRLEKDLNPLADYALTPDGRALLVGHYSGGLDVIPFVGEAKKTDGLLLATIAVSPNSKRAAVGSTDGFVHLVDLTNPKQTVRLVNDDEPEQMAFSHDGKTLYLITRTSLNVLQLP